MKKTITKIGFLILFTSIIFGCKEDDQNLENISLANIDNEKIRDKESKDYTQIYIDINDPNYIDNLLVILDANQIIEATFDTESNVVYHILENSNPNNEPNNPLIVDRQITCELSDEKCRLKVRQRWQYNVNNGICFDFGQDPYNNMIWICDEPCEIN